MSSSSSSPSNSDSDSDSDIDSRHRDAADTTKAPRPRRGVQRTQKLVDNSQTAKELAALKGWKGKGPTRRKLGKKAAAAAAAAAAAEMSQLLDGYQPLPSSAVLLKK
jgi:ferric-dicitrate binding protein FerR (iron transport regulator)